MHSLEICALLDVRGFFFCFFFIISLCRCQPRWQSRHLLVRAKTWQALSMLSGGARQSRWKWLRRARVMPGRKVHLWTMACFHRRASPQNAADEGGDFGKMAFCVFDGKCLPRTAARLKKPG